MTLATGHPNNRAVYLVTAETAVRFMVGFTHVKVPLSLDTPTLPTSSSRVSRATDFGSTPELFSHFASWVVVPKPLQ